MNISGGDEPLRWLVTKLKQASYGAAAGGGLVLLLSLFGFGPDGWQFDRLFRAVGVALILVMLVDASFVIGTQYVPLLGVRVDEESAERKKSMIPFLTGTTLVLLAAFFWTGDRLNG